MSWPASPRLVLDIAGWEFLRFFKLKDFVLTVFLIVGFGLAAHFATKLMNREDTDRVTIAVTDMSVLPGLPEDHARFEFVESHAPMPELEQALADKTFGGVLRPTGPDAAELIVVKSVAWEDELGRLLSERRQEARITGAGLTGAALDALLAPFELDRRTTGRDRSEPDRIVVIVMISLMLFGVFLGNSYVFVSITGEKTQRVTEQIIAAVSPQAWIDGKILGLSALVLVNLLVYVAGYLIYAVAAALIWRVKVNVPGVVVDPVLFLNVLLLAFLGFFFWFSFFAVVAATISDPNTSARSSFIMLPTLPLGAAFAGLGQVDGLWMRVLAILPFSSPTVMPTRLVMGDVHPLEFLAAVVLLGVSIVFLRRAAGKVFGLGMLMYGKEPTWGEVSRWIREA